MAKPTKTPTTLPAAQTDAAKAPEPPDWVLRRHAENVENLTFDTLTRAQDAGVDIMVAVGQVSVEAYQGQVISGDAVPGQMMGTTPLEFAAQAGLLLAAARAAQAKGCAQQATDDGNF